jgi:hypothetical protein
VSLFRLNGSYAKYARDLVVGDVMLVPGLGLLAIEKAERTGAGHVALRAVGSSYALPEDSIIWVEPSPDFIEALLVLQAVQNAVEDGRAAALSQALGEVRRVVIQYRKAGVL